MPHNSTDRHSRISLKRKVEFFCRSLLRDWRPNRTPSIAPLSIDALELEPRVLFDAAPLPHEVADAGFVGELNDHYIAAIDLSDPFQLLDAIEAELSELLVATPLVERDYNDAPEDWNESETSTPGSRAEAAPQRRELIVVDGSIPGLDQLAQAWHNLEQGDHELTILTLQPGENGLSTIYRQLAESEFRFDAIHLFTHGQDGAIQLGNQWLDQNNLGQHASELMLWRGGLTAQADLLLDGCWVADGQDVQQWLINLSGLPGVDLQAKTNLTSPAHQSGDWELEFSLGQIEFSRLLTSEPGDGLNLLLATSPANADLIVGTTETDIKAGLVGDDVLPSEPNTANEGQFLQGTVSGVDANDTIHGSGSPAAIAGGWSPDLILASGGNNTIGSGPFPDGKHFTAIPDINLTSHPPGQIRSNDVVLIDRQLADFDSLVGAVHANALVFVYDSQIQSAFDILEQVGNWAESNHSQISSLSILSHGVDGAFQLGSTWIDAPGLELLHTAWLSVSQSLRDDASIYLLSCDVAGSAAGRELVDSLAELMSVQVFASDDITGRGGDWILEYSANGGLLDSSQQIESVFDMEELSTAHVTLAWYGPSWRYRQSVTISSSLLDGTVDVSNFVVLVDTTQSALRSTANGGRVGQADGGDFVFTLSDEVTKLKHQIESYDPVTGRIKAWVQVPTLSALSNTSLFLYYGNATVANQWDDAGTWSSSYGGVWHLSNGLFTDSTGNANNGANSGSTDPLGIIEEGRAFNGSNQSISVADSNSLDETSLLTISAWIYPTINDSQWRTIVSKGNDGSLNYWFGIRQSQLEF